MRTNLNELKDQFISLFEAEPYSNCKNITVKINDKKAEHGIASLNIKIVATDNKPRPTVLDTTLYIIEQTKGITVLYTHNSKHDVIFTKYDENAVQDSIKYIERYLYTSTCKMLGIEIEK